LRAQIVKTLVQINAVWPNRRVPLPRCLQQCFRAGERRGPVRAGCKRCGHGMDDGAAWGAFGRRVLKDRRGEWIISLA
jgi:hypothetical protein